jgi:hypothetical protein
MKMRMRIVLAAVVFFAGWAGVAAAQTTAAVDRQPNKQVIGAEAVKQLLLLMDTDKNGMISKQEWMNFMSAEFDRLDKDKSGELDVKELTQSKIRASHVGAQGK